MENSNDNPESFWITEAALMRRFGSAALVAAGFLAVSGRIGAAAKIAAVSGGSFVISEIERRLGERVNDR